MKLKILCISMLVINICCCSVRASKIGKADAEDFVEKITYKEDKRVDLCFAIVASRRPSSVTSSGLAMANVPCTEKVRQLIKEQNE